MVVLQKNDEDRNLQEVSSSLMFSLEGVMNVHNERTWADENLHATCTHASQNKFTFNVWAFIVGNCLLSRQILPERLDGCIYFTFLQNVSSSHAE